MTVERAAKRRRLSPSGKQGTSLPGFATWNLEQDYERRDRKDKKKRPVSNRLPVKSQESGKWEQDTSEQLEDNDEKDAFPDLDVEDEQDSGVADLAPQRAPPKRSLSSREEIRQAKEELAKIASQINEDPDEHIGQLGSLAELARSRNTTVKKLALATQLSVYKSIVPGYRIRPLSKDDANAKVSKDVKKLRTFEQSLLRGYQSYVQLLSKLARKSTRDAGEQTAGVASVAISCACNLLIDLPHFNFRNDVIGILVEKVSNRTIDEDFVKCREALEQIFRDEEEGHASLEAVSQVTKMMKSKNYHINETLLNTFLHLRLLSEFAHKASTNRVDRDDEPDGSGKSGKAAKKKREFRSKRERKLLRERKEVEKEMKEADAVVSYEERDKNQAEMLKLIFVAYFRILKARTPHLMGAVLEGLAKYAHLINQDFFGDILEALKDLIRDSFSTAEKPDDDEQEAQLVERNSGAVRESLLCVITAFALLQGQQDVAKSANSLHLDLDFFTTHLYRTLLPLALDQDVELSSNSTHMTDPNGLDVPNAKDNKVNVSTTTVLLLRSLQAVLLPPTATKMVPPVRVAAFSKQLQTASLHLPQKSAEAVLGLMLQVTKIHGGKISSLWNTEERKGDGVFDAVSEEYASSNPFASTVWEGELLRLHFDPKVRDTVKGMAKNVIESR